MSNQEINQYVVTLDYQAKGLSDLLELSSTLVSGGFSTTLNDKEGHPHELGTNNFGIITPLSPEEIKQQVESIGEGVLGVKPEIEIQTWEAFRRNPA
jgi:hypothetical protein